MKSYPHLALIQRFGPPLALLLLAILFFYQIAFSGLILARGDTFNYFYPYWDARNTALQAGMLPLWSPDLFMGIPLLANPQLGTFYPPNWPLVVLSAPHGVSVSILLHIIWALWGMYALARQQGLQRLAALMSATVFGLGGYIGAHVEQINQLQGMAWLPWLLLLTGGLLKSPRRNIPLLSAALALQFLSGHTQTVFISGVGLGLYVILWAVAARATRRQVGQAMLGLILAATLATPLMLPQLLPTLELMALSPRSGGLSLNEATSFSFNPLVMGRGLLPSYDAQLFGEFVAYTGIIALGLAGLILLLPRGARYSQKRILWGGLALLGLLLALGEFNPLYVLLANLPGFNAFRVPARWLALWAVGIAILTGYGLQALHENQLHRGWKRILLCMLILIALACSTQFTPAEQVSGPATPTLHTWAGWGVALLAFLFLMRWRSRYTAWLAAGLLLLELALASQVQPYNTLAPPETYLNPRFTASQVHTLNEAGEGGRLLSISGLLFDPGDKATLTQRYESLGLSVLAQRYGLVATKRQEIIAPNLPLTWGLPSIDGFDGGLLPTRYYAAFSTLLSPEGVADGRLFEMLAQADCGGACLPDQRWLNLTHTRWLITDKVFDRWYDGIAYDTQFGQMLHTGTGSVWANPTGFMADSIDVLHTQATPPLPDQPIATQQTTTFDEFHRTRYTLPTPSVLTEISFSGAQANTLQAVTLTDTRTGDFIQLAPAPWQRRLSSDIKLYENFTAQPRAFIAPATIAEPDTTQALTLMQAATFDPTQQAILHMAQARTIPNANGTITIQHESATQLTLDAESDTGGWLILTDAYYPGWQAHVNGELTPIIRANIMFRAVEIPAGHSQVVFSYEPGWRKGVAVGGRVWLVWLVVTGWQLIRRRSGQSAPASGRND